MALGGKTLLLRRADWLRGQRGLRELTATTFPGGVADCSSWAGLAAAVEPTFPSGAWDRNGPPEWPNSPWTMALGWVPRAGCRRTPSSLEGH